MEENQRYTCATCGIQYTINKYGEKQFYWSHRNIPATKAQVIERVCQYIKDPEKEKGCANRDSVINFGQQWLGDFIIE